MAVDPEVLAMDRHEAMALLAARGFVRASIHDREDALQDALLTMLLAVRRGHQIGDRVAFLATVMTRRLLDSRRRCRARLGREQEYLRSISIRGEDSIGGGGASPLCPAQGANKVASSPGADRQRHAHNTWHRPLPWPRPIERKAVARTTRAVAHPRGGSVPVQRHGF